MTVRLILLVAAIVCFAVAALASHGTITTSEGGTWLASGLVLFATSFLPER